MALEPAVQASATRTRQGAVVGGEWRVVARALVGWLCVPSAQVIGGILEATAYFNFPPRADGV
jgi:hypothetical protein